MSQRKTREEWQRILEDQRTRSITDIACAQEHDVSVSQLKRWRSLVGGRRATSIHMVEINPEFPSSKNLTINLRRNAALEIPLNWPVSKIAQLIRELGLI